jgi:aminoglycoside phosphotransferase (APT) family kinase protein
MRHDAMKRVQLAEQGLVATSASAMVADINQPALEEYLRKRLGSDQLRVTEFKFLAGGRARQTALFTVAGTDDIPPRLVLQRDHPGSIGSLSGVGMQYSLLKHIHATGMKVARPVMVERSPEPLGAPFMVSEQVQGTSPVPSMGYWSPPPKSDRLAASLAEQIAKMHSISINGLDEVMSRDVDEAKGQTWHSDVNSLEEQWERLAHAPSMAVTAALAWMRAHASCADGVETIVHNDALLHNVLVEHDEITAVLDWEMAHIGHPFEDLGYVRPVVEQMTDWPRFIDAYVSAGGRRPTQEQIDFFTLRSIMKLLTNVIQARAAFDSGRTDDPTMAEVGAAFLPKLIERLATQLNMILGH